MADAGLTHASPTPEVRAEVRIDGRSVKSRVKNRVLRSAPQGRECRYMSGVGSPAAAPSLRA